MARQMLKRFVLDGKGYFATLLIDADEELGERPCEDCGLRAGIAIRARLLYLQRGTQYLLVHKRHGRRVQEIVQKMGWAVRWICVECYDPAIEKIYLGQKWRP